MNVKSIVLRYDPVTFALVHHHRSLLRDELSDSIIFMLFALLDFLKIE